MKSILAKFQSTGKEYEYFVPEDDCPNVGDYVITSLASERQAEEYGKHPVNMATVVAINELATTKATKEYLWRIPLAELKERAVDAMLNASRRKAKADALAKLKDLATEEMLLKTLAESTNPEIQRLLKVARGED